jgi:flagellar biosynthesis regulator FlbT
MPMFMTLNPGEWIMIGESRIMNIHPTNAKFDIEGSAAILRQDWTMTQDDADTPAKLTYFAIQQAYLSSSKDFSAYRAAATILMRDDPESKPVILKATGQIAKGNLYAALRTFRTYIQKTSELKDDPSAYLERAM